MTTPLHALAELIGQRLAERWHARQAAARRAGMESSVNRDEEAPTRASEQPNSSHTSPDGTKEVEHAV